MSDLLAYTYEYLVSGGWVMVPLSLGCVVLSFMVLERLKALKALSADDLTIQDAIRAVEDGGEAVQGKGLRARLVRSFLADRSHDARLDVDIMRECSMKQAATLDTSIAVIGVLVSTAPLLGLLGTVLGMIQTFQVISLFGTGNANAMASGISVALITTEAGLLVAVPGIFLSGLLMQRSSRLTLQLEEDTAILTRTLRRLVRKDAHLAAPGVGATRRRETARDDEDLEPAFAGAAEGTL
jgi:biopolymer transport protein ExbB